MRSSFFSITLMTLLVGSASAQVPAPQPQPVQTPAPVANTIPPAPVPSGASAWLLMEYETGEILAGVNVDQRLEPASITKVMTSYVAAAEMQAGRVKLDDKVVISERAWKEGGAGTEGSFSGFELGKPAKFEDLEKGMAISSGNDAAIAIAEHVGGSVENFASLMNAYAKKLGMKNSNFTNPHGLSDPNHYTTARDLAILGRAYVRNYPNAYAYNKIKEFTVGNITQYNRNNLLARDPSVDGIKTGHTNAAGYCLMASAKRGEQRFISVVMGIQSQSRNEGFKLREDGNLNLLNWAFRFYESHRMYNPNQKIATQKLWKGQTEQINLGLAEAVIISVPRGRYKDLKPSMNVPKQVVAPLKKGQSVGTLKISLDGKVLVERPLVALESAPEAGFFGRLWDEFWMWWES
jgi:serine-type D-Ala-D-Ala carboxypeptidase (penicillin-binding protein 5/6)